MRATVWTRCKWVLFVPSVVVALAWVLRRPHVTVSIPVSPAVWSRWRRRVVLCQGVAAFGIGLIVTGSALRAAPPLAGGVVVFLIAIALRARANRNWWITAVLDTTREVVVVEPTHSEFDRAARDIFVRSIR